MKWVWMLIICCVMFAACTATAEHSETVPGNPVPPPISSAPSTSAQPPAPDTMITNIQYSTRALPRWIFISDEEEVSVIMQAMQALKLTLMKDYPYEHEESADMDSIVLCSRDGEAQQILELRWYNGRIIANWTHEGQEGELEAFRELVRGIAAPYVPISLDESYLTLTTNSADLADIGRTLFVQDKERFMGEDIPDYYRLEDYRIRSVRAVAGDLDEFCVAIVYDYLVPGAPIVDGVWATYHMSANGEGAEDSGWWLWNYVEYRVKRIAPDTYMTFSIGTGGGGDGLAPIK